MKLIPLDRVILYIISSLSKTNVKIGRTRIIKLLYLIDLVAKKRLGSKITSVTYHYHFYGPYSQEILDVIDKLVEAAKVKDTIIPTSIGIPAHDYRSNQENKNILNDIDSSQKQIIDEILSRYGRMRLDKLLEVVYSTKPMREKVPGDELL